MRIRITEEQLGLIVESEQQCSANGGMMIGMESCTGLLPGNDFDVFYCCGTINGSQATTSHVGDLVDMSTFSGAIQANFPSGLKIIAVEDPVQGMANNTLLSQDCSGMPFPSTPTNLNTIPGNCSSTNTDIIATECDGTGGGLFPCMYLDNNWATTSNIGDVFQLSPPWSGGMPPSNSKTPYVITGFGTGTQCTTPTAFAHTINGCPGTGVPCASGAWPNYSNWVTSWSDPIQNGIFNPTNGNPNQPCNHICQRILHWETSQITSGPYQQNVLACKIDEGNNQALIHGCTC